jgi:2-dehydro-3-deoxy-D-gluconate 5-dehydrogenase
MLTVCATGGRRGIGRAIALAFLNDGADVTVISKSADRGDLPNDLHYMSFDLSVGTPDYIDFPGKVDVLVNCAGIGHAYTAMEYPEYERRRLWQLNYHSPVNLACMAVSLGCKRVINITSVSAFNGARRVSEYAASKAALTQWTKCASNEWAGNGVTVNCVAPGFIQTDMLKLADPQAIIGRIPEGRIGTPEDVTGAVLFLASKEASYITGTTIVVDGGWIAR